VPPVSRLCILALSDYFEHRGIDTADVLGSRSGHSESCVRLRDYCHQLKLAAEFFGDPLLGMHVGASSTIEQFGLLGFAARAASNLAEALQLGLRFYSLINSESRLQLSIEGACLRITWQPHADNARHYIDHYTHLRTAALTNIGRTLVGMPQGAPRLVSFTSAAPQRKHELERHFGCQAIFDQQQDALDVDFEQIITPLTRADEPLFGILAQQLEATLADHQPPRTSQEEEIATIVESLARHGIPTIDEVARVLGSSTRDLIRALAAEGLLFRKIRDARLGLIAQRLLLSKQSIAEVALQVGYSEQSSFTRSFKRWTGISPQQWRRDHRAQAGAREK
jgi:AraC-like DNA-binding protein